ncbi:TPA: b12-dependent methionine synthase, partial [Klebsiella variicola]|nr:b12-dependent methionine synthase [Klebsiella variicola]
IPDNFVMEVIAKSGKNRRTESDYIGFLYMTGNIRSAIYYRAVTGLIRIAKMKSLIG